jgi:hypothetical protein
MRSSSIIAATFLLLMQLGIGLAQAESSLLQHSPYAFVHVNVIPMNSESVLAEPRDCADDYRFGPRSRIPLIEAKSPMQVFNTSAEIVRGNKGRKCLFEWMYT